MESGSVSYDKATPYLPVIDLLKAYFKIQDRHDQREIREKVTGKLLTLDESLKPTLPAFLALLDLPVDDPHGGPRSSEKRQGLWGSVKRLLLKESQVQPLVLLFEDLHWIDRRHKQFSIVIDSPANGTTLLLVNYRPIPTWLDKQDLLLSTAARSSAGGERRRIAAELNGERAESSPTQTTLDYSHRGQSVLLGGERPNAGGNQSARRRTGRLPLGQTH